MSTAGKRAYNKDMDSYVTKSDLYAAVDDLGEQIATLANYVHKEITEMRDELRSVRRDYAHVMDNLDNFLKRMADKDIEDAARDAQLGRHEKWIHTVAKNTDTELTY